HATHVTLLIYDDRNYEVPVASFHLHYLLHKSHRIWHCRLKKAQLNGGIYYAYKIDGPDPEGPFEWHTFDREKVLLDPFAESVFFPPAFDRTVASLPGPNDGRAPLGVIFKNSHNFDWEEDKRPHHESDLVIYELHVKGFSFHPSSA